MKNLNLSKIEILLTKQNFGQKTKFWSKIEIFQKSEFWSKIKIKHEKYGQNTKCLTKILKLKISKSAKSSGKLKAAF